MKKILFGTNNLHKLREIRAILASKYEVLGLKELAIDMDVEETEPTLEGNAILKAKAYAEVAGIPCFADDTGLEVVALDGRPGVYSARYAGPGKDPEDNMKKLLGELEGKEDHRAQFRTVICYYDGEEEYLFEGKVEGEIIAAKRGEGGFGYDPVFVPAGYDLSFAEMDPAEKNAISHRGRAVALLTEFLLKL